ncbi:WhiB family transcriptional regulator [Nocardia pseudobrasiliensis]|uniref:Transcriptional regulator WhiB n=1 Tax=Nocardia pseudobrasiliensis TaxID=45979 RepID=A0A370HXV5_9NOCA|nr:WhiB family transcriptional regulator [Nocardia pseudobrasiliensis]RDI63342.1 WhiB family redox-sensing transcriptional regulator [Nocardia pseudobrasiliensis]
MPLPIPTSAQLPAPNADIWDWQIRGACRGLDSSLFFYPDGERGRARTARENRAKQICHTCPVLAQCRTYALRVREPYGVWGAMTEAEREKYTRRRRAAA